MKLHDTRAVLVTVILAQFLCTSSWFAGNAVLNGLIRDFGLSPQALGHLTVMVQFGFITGTFVFALLRIADRFSPARVFLVSALISALTNVGVILDGNSLGSLFVLRYIDGFMLAGIYPVGMKIASDYFEKGLGKALGYLVGALVMGTALPHLLTGIGRAYDWRLVIIGISILTALGGLMVGILIKDGPYRKPAQQLNFENVFEPFRITAFRKAALGYFGHMWELYTFWAFIPIVLIVYAKNTADQQFDISLVVFCIVGIGALGCICNGYLSKYVGAGNAARYALLISGLCCVFSPWIFQIASMFIVILILLIWGLAVVADSPMFSTIVAWEAPADMRGTALTMVTCIGFAITIVSIQLFTVLMGIIDVKYLFLFLAPGPLLGLLAMRGLKQKRNA